MPKPNPLREKSYEFSKKIVYFCRKMQEQKEFFLSKQLLKSGTSIGANIAEANQAQSKLDFISKLSIALKEGHESDYWLRLIRDTTPKFAHDVSVLLQELNEIISLLTASINTSKKSLR